MSNPKRNANKTLQIHGIHAVYSYLQQTPENISALTINPHRRDDKFKSIIALAKSHSIPIHYSEQLNKNTQGVVASIENANKNSTQYQTIEELVQHHQEKSIPLLLLILDNIQDPHNLGACIRSANASGCDAVIIPADNSATLTATVRKVAVGAVEFTPVFTVTNLSRTLKYLKECGVWIYGLESEATKTLYQENYHHSTAFILGSESSGLRRLTKEHCDIMLSIPMKGQVESLNVSVAAGICLFEALRQRIHPLEKLTI